MSESTLVRLTQDSERRCPVRMPAAWQPPVPAFIADISRVQSAVVSCVGVQSSSGQRSEALFRLRDFYSRRAARVEHAWHVDAQSYRNDVLVCYFDSMAVEQKAAQELAQWWDSPDRLSEGTGYWRETFTAPATHRETLFSGNDRPAGMGALSSSAMLGPIAEHGYWGSVRDRIPASAHDDLQVSHGADPQLHETAGRRIRLTPHANLCIIRSGKDITDCAGRELDLYLGRVHPTLIRGMDFLRDHPEETGCYSCRFMAELDDEGQATKRSFGLAAFASLGHLEAWAESHPTHLAIFNEFLAMAGQLGAEMRLRLWHEVFVLPEGEGHRFEYLNCHPATGLLPFVGAMTSF